MYGQIHCVIRELVVTKFGNETWEVILRKSQMDEHDCFLMFTRYDDACTYSLVGAVSDTLGVSVETVLEIFGEFFFDYCLRHGYDKMLRTLGSDIKSFIQNLDSLHSLLALSYKGISAPSFRCEDGKNGELILHYYSGRPGLYPIVKGVLKAVARDLFDQLLEMSVIEQNKEDIGCNQSQEHTAFRVLLRTESVASESVSQEGTNSDIRGGLVEFNPDKILLRATDFCSAFPYHVIFDRKLRIRQCGDLIRKHSNTTLTDGTPLTGIFNIVHPKMVLTIENIRKFINAVFLLAIKPGDREKRAFLLKGQMIWLSDTQNMIFIGSPRLTSLNELMEMNVYLADIPLYDVTRELVLLNQQRIAEIDIAKKLDETTAELKRTSQALEEEKSKTETLLHQMLPQKVAKALTNGQKVEAEKFDQVTILFSDIVTFTNIASACSPMDIVNMLNEMYQRFDERTSQHNVYKVETIGDAYMIVSGVPEQTSDHAQPVANFAMDMVQDAGLVRSPATGLPLQIRVGVHTGPVVAGVVGVKMPRYCLFGDTVNTASRMESHGVPGRIHLSPTAYQALRGWGYAFKHRGKTEIKGKGLMDTYFLCGHLDHYLEEPIDTFLDLNIFQDSAENMDKWSVVLKKNLGNMGTDGSESHDTFQKSAHKNSSEGRPTFELSSNADENSCTINSFEDETISPNKLCRGISFQTVIKTESSAKLDEQSNISRLSAENIHLQKDKHSNTTNNSGHSSNTTVLIPSSSSHSSLAETDLVGDCVYINGSFQNEYPRESSDKHKRPPSRNKCDKNELDLHDEEIKRVTFSCESNETNIQRIVNSTTSDSIHTQPETPDGTTVIKPISWTFSSSHLTSSTSNIQSHPMSKSQTFSAPGTCSTLLKTHMASLSHADLKNVNNDTKRKHGKKRNSKFCSII